MKLTTRALPALIAIVVLGLPNAFAVDGKTICVDVDIPDSGTVTITLSPTEQPGVLRGDDGSWWWEPSNGEPPFRLPDPDPKPDGDPEPEDEPKPDDAPQPDDDSDGDESTEGVSQDYDEDSEMYLDLLLIEFLMEEGCSIEEVDQQKECPRPSKLDRPVFGPHMITCDVGMPFLFRSAH